MRRLLLTLFAGLIGLSLTALVLGPGALRAAPAFYGLNQGGAATPALIDSSSDGTGGASGTTTPPINTTGANLIVVAVQYYIGASGLTLTDSKSNTWTALTERSDTLDGKLRLYYCAGGAVGTGHTFTFAGTAVYAAIQVFAFSNAAGSPFDAETPGTVSGTSWASLATGSLTPAQNNVILISAAMWNGVAAAGMSLDGGFSTPLVNPWTSSSLGGAAAYKIITNGAAHNVTWNPGTSVTAGAVVLASFKY
jgi:hypothetical protein